MPVRTDIRLTGVREVSQAGRKMVEEDTIRITDGLAQSAVLIFDYSQELVPVETGDLKLSGRVEEVSGVGLFASSVVEYGGPDAPYAWIVHEDLAAHHESPTQAKYLSHAVELAHAEVQQVLRRQFLSNTHPVRRR